VLHAPVDAPVTGSKHGAQRLATSQLDWGSWLAWLATFGRQVDRHRPSALPMDRHVGAACC
jgi:hypothetical protein